MTRSKIIFIFTLTLVCCTAAKRFHQDGESMHMSILGGSCSSDKVAFSAAFTVPNDREKCSFIIKDKTTGRIVKSVGSFSSNFQSFNFCEPPAIYTLVLKKSDASGWGSNHASIKNAEGNEILNVSLDSGREKEFAFNIAYLVQPRTTSWSYSHSAQGANWYTSGESINQWPKATYGQFPSTSAITQYYSTEFNINDFSAFSSIRFSVIVNAGAIFYFNDVEIGRVHMREGEISSEDRALESFPKPVWYSFSQNVLCKTVKNGLNRFSVELHAQREYEAKPTFDGKIQFIVDEGNMLMNGLGLTDPYNPDSKHGTNAIFDKDPDTIFIAAEANQNITVTWAYMNAEEVINHYTIYASSCNSHYPSAWYLEGSHDSFTWYVLHRRSHFRFGANRNHPFTFYNELPFAYYRLRIIETEYMKKEAGCENDRMYIGDIQLYSKQVFPTCFMEEFPPSIKGEEAFLPCPAYSVGVRSALCTETGFETASNDCNPLPPQNIYYPESVYTFRRNEEISPIVPLIEAWGYYAMVNPALPDGILIDSASGTISGTPTKESPLADYTIHVRNTAGDAEFVMTISVAKKDLGSMIGLIILELVIVVIIVIAIIVTIRVLTAKGYLKRSGQTRTLPRKQTQEE